ncbi:TetR/AcrR family transcriptional regulator [Gordonia sp. CPCC 206044]|uniref:TetR/AcrR family transcriptional regulator n=1 Tax=Gordonia sp. CPCC 206044 TaxID=3140793 RepID=UPI003AF3FAFA
MSASSEATPASGTRAALIRAGVELLDESGPDAVGLRAISRRADVSHGAPRRHFPTHRALLAAVARTGVEDLRGVVQPILRSSADPRDRLVDAALAYVTFARRRRAMFDLMTRHDLLEGSGERLRETSIPFLRAVAAVVDEASGEPADPLRVAGLWAAVHGIAALTADHALDIWPNPVEPASTTRELVCHAVDAALRP